MLTSTQHQCMLAIQRHIARTGYAPTFDELRAAVGLNNRGGVHRLVTALEDRGYIRRIKNRWRAIEVLRPVDSDDFTEAAAAALAAIGAPSTEDNIRAVSRAIERTLTRAA